MPSDLQVSETWRDSGGFRLFQICGEMRLSEEGLLVGEAKEWSPGKDVLEGSHSKVGEQRFSIQSKSSRRVVVDPPSWYPVTVRVFTGLHD